MKQCCLFFLLIFFCFNIKAQQLSLQQAETYRVNEDYTKAIVLAKKNIQSLLQQKKWLDAVKFLTILNNTYGNMDDFKHAIKYEDEAMKIALKSKDATAIAYAFLAKAYTQYSIGEPDEVVKNCNLALTQLGNTSENFLSAKIYMLLYAVHSAWNHVKETNLYAQKALENALLTTDYNLMSNCYFAVSVANDFNYYEDKSAANLKKIVAPLEAIIALQQQHKNKVSNKILALAYMNTANYYFKNFPVKDLNARKLAISNAEKVLETAQKIKFNHEVIASALGLMSEYALRDGNKVQAEKYLLNAYSIMQTQAKVYNYTMLNVLGALVNLYEENGNYKAAFKYQKEGTEYNQELFNQEQMKNTQKLEVQFDTEKKNNAIKLLEEKASSHRKQNYLFIGLVAVALVGSFFMFRSYNFRLKYSLEREGKLSIEKNEAELQTKFEKEEQERLKAEQLLLALQQQQLQKEIMANALQLEHKNEVLQNLKQKLNTNESINIQKIMREENLFDNDFEQATFRIKEINPNFFNSLHEKSQQKLSALDLKYCAYLHLNMDTKQIANLLNVEPKSVRMTKYRLKQKLNLTKDEELSEFLRKL